jgi:phosphopantetheinyl transferase (holo-ACP synthase)
MTHADTHLPYVQKTCDAYASQRGFCLQKCSLTERERERDTHTQTRWTSRDKLIVPNKLSLSLSLSLSHTHTHAVQDLRDRHAELKKIKTKLQKKGRKFMAKILNLSGRHAEYVLIIHRIQYTAKFSLV